MNHHPRRVVSPPFAYDPRPMDNRPGYDDPYQSMHRYEGPPGPSGPPFMGDQHSYPVNYHDRPPGPHQTQRSYSPRLQYSMGGLPPSPQPHPPRSNTPPYKILCITNINPKIGDNTVKEALMTDYSRFGVASVSVCHDNGERLVYIYFQNYEEAREARYSKSRTLFFDRPIEIEPIFDPRADMNGSPIEASPPMTTSVSSMYPTRRRSITPDYPDINGPISLRRHQQPPYPHQTQGPTAHMHHHRGVSPLEYPPNHVTPYPYGPSAPEPMGPAPIPIDRRSGHGGVYGHGQPPHGINPHSPYASPPHETYRSSYLPPHHMMSLHQFEQPSTSPYAGEPYGPPHHGHHHHLIGRGERDRPPNETAAYIRSRSPRGDPYLSQRTPIVSHQYPASRSAHSSNSDLSPSIHQQSSLSSKYRSPPPPITQQHYRSHHRPDPPARYMSREFRREKFGADNYNTEHDDGRPSRVLLVNNIDSTKSTAELKDIFRPFGIVEEMEVKEVSPGVSSALIKFSSMDGAYKAKSANDGRHIGSTRCRIVYGKVSASRRLWIGGLNPSTTVAGLDDECCKYGEITNIEYTSGRPYAYVEYESANQAQFAAHHMKTTLTPANERKIRIEFVDPERSEKLAPNLDMSNTHNSESFVSKPRGTNDSWASNELDPSPQRVSSARKRSSTPSDLSGATKRICQTEVEIPIGSNTFKQERLAAAAAAKARSSSMTTSTASTPGNNLDVSEESDKRHSKVEERDELNNSGNDDGFSSATTRDQSTEENVKETPSSNELNQSISIHNIVQHCPVSWPSQITLRNFTFPARIFLCSGRKQLIDRYFMSCNNNENGFVEDYCPILHITQRWRLHPQPKLEEVKRRMQSGNSDFLIIVARHEDEESINEKRAVEQIQEKSTSNNDDQPANIDQNSLENHQQNDYANNLISDIKIEPCENDKNSDDVARPGPDVKIDQNDRPTTNQTASSAQSRPLRNLISYLEQKDAAGVISLNALDSSIDHQIPGAGNEIGSSKLLYAFPPCEFALNLIKRMAPNLTSEASKEEFLLGVIVGSNEAKA